MVTCDALVVVHAGDAHEGDASYAEEEHETVTRERFSFKQQMLYELSRQNDIVIFSLTVSGDLRQVSALTSETQLRVWTR